MFVYTYFYLIGKFYNTTYEMKILHSKKYFQKRTFFMVNNWR